MSEWNDRTPRPLRLLRDYLMANGARTVEYYYDVRTTDYRVGVTMRDGRRAEITAERQDMEVAINGRRDDVIARDLIAQFNALLPQRGADRADGTKLDRAIYILQGWGYRVRTQEDGLSISNYSQPGRLANAAQEIIIGLQHRDGQACHFIYTPEMQGLSDAQLAAHLDSAYRSMNDLPPRTREGTTQRRSPLEDKLAEMTAKNRELHEKVKKLEAIIAALKGEPPGSSRRVRMRGRG